MIELNLPQGVSVEEEQDNLGGAFIIDSGIYKGETETVYLDKAPSGALRVTINFKPNGQNKVIPAVFYISNKNGQFTYKDKQTGEDRPLPGYSQMDTFFKVTTGKGIAEQVTETKTLSLYNPSQQKEVPTDVSMFMDAIKKTVVVGVLKISREKTTKESNYTKGNGQFVDVNEFDKFFYEDGRTLKEALEGKNSPEFILKWKEKNTGVIKVKKAKISGGAANTGTTSGMPGAGSTPAIDPFAND